MTPTTKPRAPLDVPVPAWVGLVEWACILGLVVLLVWLGWRRWRRHHRPKVSDSEAAHRRWVAWVAARWMWDVQNIGLVLVDETTRHRRQFLTGQALPPVTRIPRVQFWPAPNGIRAVMETVPGVGLEQVAKKVDHLANAWGCIRVDVTPARPRTTAAPWLPDRPTGSAVAHRPGRTPAR